MTVRLRRLGALLTSLLLAGLLGTAGLFVGTVAWLRAGEDPLPRNVVVANTGLVSVPVDRWLRPSTVAEVQALVRRHEGPLSIGGGGYSMGGQVASPGTLFLDLRDLDEVLALDVEARTVRVQAGISWRALIEHVDPHDLSPKIMQSYANFSVGGSLSVNAHGRYMGLGPVVHSVRQVELVLADGSLVTASRTERPELFWGAIGGYGALGVIVTVDLDLAENVAVARHAELIASADLVPWFRALEAQGDAVFFNADLYPPDYEEGVAITFSATDRAPTVPERLQPMGTSSRLDRLMYWWVSDGPLGKEARQHLLDPVRLRGERIVWRNHEASYDVASLDPGPAEDDAYILQEYFVPVERLGDFLPRMREVFAAHDVNVVNASIRHAIADPDTLLSWAPTESFAVVIYHKMGTDPAAWEHARTWTRAMADALLEVGGRWYLPYQIHPTPEQFAQAYPRAPELFALKQQVDPDYAFRNLLWDTYLPPTATYGGPGVDVDAVRARLAARSTWARPEDQTFLTLPEWMIVYSADELGPYLAEHPPSTFPWFAAIGQFWRAYRAVWSATEHRYAFNRGYHLMIGVIGVSYTLEYGLKGLYEGTLGWLAEQLGDGSRTPEEVFYAGLTTDYGAFTHHTPWFGFDFAGRRAQLGGVGADAPGGLRRWERWAVTSLELAVKQAYAGLLAGGTQAVYGAEATTLEVWLDARDAAPGAIDRIDGVEVIEELGGGHLLARLPRYEPFTTAVLALTRAGVDLVEIAGGDVLVVQVQAPADWDPAPFGDVLIAWPLLGVAERQRVALVVSVGRLDEVLPALEAEPVQLERLYDF